MSPVANLPADGRPSDVPDRGLRPPVGRLRPVNDGPGALGGPCGWSTDATPPDLVLPAAWPAHRQLVIDLALAGAVIGLLVGFVAGHPAWGGLGIVLGGATGATAGRWLGPRRYVLRLDARGVRIGRLLRSVTIPWSDVRAFGVAETWSGRRGRMIGLAVCRVDVVLPVAVPALTFRENGWGRIGSSPRPDEAVEAHRPRLLEPVRAWAEAKQVPTVSSDVDSWWEIHQDEP